MLSLTIQISQPNSNYNGFPSYIYISTLIVTFSQFFRSSLTNIVSLQVCDSQSLFLFFISRLCRSIYIQCSVCNARSETYVGATEPFFPFLRPARGTRENLCVVNYRPAVTHDFNFVQNARQTLENRRHDGR